jgi:hypothetical protein
MKKSFMQRDFYVKGHGIECEIHDAKDAVHRDSANLHSRQDASTRGKTHDLLLGLSPSSRNRSIHAGQRSSA